MGAMQEPVMVCGFANFVFCKLHRVNEFLLEVKQWPASQFELCTPLYRIC